MKSGQLETGRLSEPARKISNPTGLLQVEDITKSPHYTDTGYSSHRFLHSLVLQQQISPQCFLFVLALS